jgi:hypothetical protein
MEKKILTKVLRQVKNGKLFLTFPDGTTRTFGSLS